DLGIVAEICDNVAIMYAGGVLEYGSVFDIFKNPCHPYTRALFDSIPDVNRDQERLKVISGLPPDPTDIPAGCPFHPRCPHCSDRCRTEKPEAVYLNDTHWVKCFLARKEGGEANE
ncbi:MAG: ABC transporter ATP-binding protein, partial [Oscillospiraceae bacterium]|nr:ABC transporter ATP-binding protein [Oscillospiraceae bacterium]